MDEKQKIQDEEYYFPYHYVDLIAPCQAIARKALFEYVVNLIRPLDGKKILDVGCGDARLFYELRNERAILEGRATLEGIDVSKKAIRWARTFVPSAKFICADIKDYNFPANSYDAIFLIDVLEHLNPRDLDFILSRLAHYLKINGKLIIVVPSINIPLDRKHYQHFSRKTLEKLLKKYFKTINILGHQRISKIHNFFFSVLNFVSLLFYADTFRYKYPKFIHKFCNFKKHYWIKNLHICDPEIARRLLAVCVKE